MARERSDGPEHVASIVERVLAGIRRRFEANCAAGWNPKLGVWMKRGSFKTAWRVEGRPAPEARP